MASKRLSQAQTLTTVLQMTKAERNDNEALFDTLWERLVTAYGDTASDVAYAAEMELKAAGRL